MRRIKVNNKIKKTALGSLTVEAALVLPIFVYAIAAFLYFLQIIYVQEILQNAITETGFFSVKYAYVYAYVDNYQEEEEESESSALAITDKEADSESDTESESTGEKIKNSVEAVIAHAIDSTYYKTKMQDYLDEDIINNSCIEGGFDGIHTYLSTYMTEEDTADIILIYNIKLPILFFNLQEITMMQRVRMRGWTGHSVEPKNMAADSSQEEEEEEQIVYITETGNVYHLTKSCSYLSLSIKEVNYSEVESLRNTSGGKYKACELCGSNGNSSSFGTVYVTDFGDRYHWNLDCSGLKRTILEIPLSQVGDKNLCSRCAAAAGN